MNGISHKQAIQLIHRRLDGMLKADQALLLDEHLDSCDVCRTYASEMEALPAQLNAELKTRWDADQGPSLKVAQHVSAQARKIPTQQRFASAMKLVTGLAVIVVLAFFMNFMVSRLQSVSVAANGTPFVSSEEPSGLVAFTSKQDGNAEIYTIHADGTGMVNLTNDPANDSFPFWSPDGRRIAFMSDRDGSTQIYLMDADGSNLTRLTEGEGDYGLDANGHSPWSPDGGKLIVLHKLLEEQTFQPYVLSLTDKSMTPLTYQPGEYILLSWSADGTHIAFVSSERGRAAADLYVVRSDGSNLIKLTDGLQAGEYFSRDYEWSPEGDSIFFATHRNEQIYQDAMYFSTIYRSSVDGVKEIAAQVKDRQIIDWWDGGNIRLELSERMMHWTRSDGSDSQVELCKKSSDMRGMAFERSHTGNLVFGFDCMPDGWMLYWIPPEATTAEPLLDRIVPYQQDSLFGLNFSSDERHIAFVTLDSTSVDLTETLYIVDVAKAREDPSTQPLRLENSFGQDWQPITDREVVEEEPTPEPTQVPVAGKLPDIATNVSNGEWIAFIAGTNGPESPAYDPASVLMHQNVFVIQPDGSNLINVTNFYAHYSNLRWSPNGQHLLFVRENADLNKVDIMRHVPDATESSALTKPILDPDHYSYSWSPNSDKIAFADASNGNYDIYTIYADGRNDPQLTQLTHDPAQDVGFVWSPDGSQIAFQRLNGDELSIYIMSEDGSNQQEVAHGMGKVTLYWSHDGRAIYASGMDENWLECEGCAHKPGIYRIDLENSLVQQVYAEELNTQQFFWNIYDTSENVLYFMRVNPPTFVELWGTWFRADGNSVQEVGELDPEQTCKTTTGNVLNEYISPTKRFSVVSNYCAGGFDLYLADRETTEPKLLHLLRLPLDTWGQGGDSATLPMGWSPDGRWLLYIDGEWKMYLLNLEQAMQDPNTKPFLLLQEQPISLPFLQTYSNSLTIFDLSWQPKP